MKNITKQYQDLLEGKMSKANFMVNVRREFPQWISPVNSFNDAVNILKSKRILSEDFSTQKDLAQLAKDASQAETDPMVQKIALAAATMAKGNKDRIGMAVQTLAKQYNITDSDKITAIIDKAAGMKLGEANAGGDRGHIGGETRQTEGHEGNTQWLEAFKDDIDNRIASLSSDEKMKVEKAMDYLGDDGLVEYYGSFLLPWAANAFMSDVEEINKKADEEEDAMIKSAGMSTMHTRRSMSPGSDPEAFEPLNEAVEGRYKEATGKAEYDKFAEMDRVDYRQLTRGAEYELLKMPEITDENYIKAKTKAYKNLIKNPKYYMHLLVAGADKVEKKDKDLRMQPVKKDSMLDKANAMKVIKKDEGSNTQDSLGKKEKAKGNPEGVKMLKEELMNEFGAALPEPPKTFAKGHEVQVPDGRTGIVASVTPDGTLTVEFPDGIQEDYQQNVINTPDQKPLAMVDKNPLKDMPNLMGGQSELGKRVGDMFRQKEKERKARNAARFGGSTDDLKEKLVRALKEDDPQLQKVDKDIENKEKELSQLLIKKGQQLAKPGSQT